MELICKSASAKNKVTHFDKMSFSLFTATNRIKQLFPIREILSTV